MARPLSIPRPSRHATGQAVVRLSGKDYYLGLHGSPEAQAAYEALTARWLAAGRILTAATGALTVNDVLLAYVRYAESYHADGARSRELGCIKDALRLVKKEFGRTPAERFGPKSLKAVRQAMVTAGWCRNYVNAQVNRVRRVFRWAVEEELIGGGVDHALRAVRGLRRGRPGVRESEPVRPVPDGFVEAVLPHLPAPVRAMVRLQLLTGMRPGEACAMRACDLETSGRVWVYRPRRHKTAHHGHAREVYIGPKAQAVVEPWLKPDLEAHLFSPAEVRAMQNAVRRRDRKTPLYPSHLRYLSRKRKRHPRRPLGDRYDVPAYRRAIARARDRADRLARQAQEDADAATEGRPAGRVAPTAPDADRLIPRWHPHQLRHNAATALRKEHGIELARIVLGHSTAFTTEIYAEADRQTSADVIARVG